MESATHADTEKSIRERTSSEHLAYAPGFGGLPSRARTLVSEIEKLTDRSMAERLLEHTKKKALNKPYGMEYPIGTIQIALQKRIDELEHD